jgi:hypothetical protein
MKLKKLAPVKADIKYFIGSACVLGGVIGCSQHAYWFPVMILGLMLILWRIVERFFMDGHKESPETKDN